MTHTTPLAIAFRFALCLLPFAGAPGACTAQEPDVKLRYVDPFPEAEAFERPLFLAHHAGEPEHMYVVGQFGHVWRVDAKDGSRTLWLDWTERTLSPRSRGHNEEGLLGFQFDPAYPEQPYVYLYYSEQREEREEERGQRRRGVPRRSVVSRLTVADTDGVMTPDPKSELRVMEVDQPWGNHNGGTIEFGPDGMLYIVFGDGGAGEDPLNSGQDLGTVLGAICRIDVRGATKQQPYKIPSDNPFQGREDHRGEIWAYGLRNPWRMSFDRETGEMWCGDVGQYLWEEVDQIVKGGNYGWNHREGTHGFTKRERFGKPPAAATVDLLGPVAEYSHEVGQSITGGYVYRGTAIPQLQGRYIYGDYVSKVMFAVAKPKEAGGLGEVLRLPEAPAYIASFGQGPDGELFLLTYGSDLNEGRIFKILPAVE